MFKRVNFIILLTLLSCSLWSQTNKNTEHEMPKLVVGIVVDQMRYDFLYRYYDRLGENGLKRLIRDGVNCINTHYNYTPTYTGPGHASIYTGSSPAVHGITSNTWYERNLAREVYCTEDNNVKGVGTDSPAGLESPRNMKSTSITDQLKLATGFRSKVIGVALKDRGSILPAGHSADAAYWYDAETGNFITSTYYRNELPQWALDFNAMQYSEKYLNSVWETLYPLETYVQSDTDNRDYEEPLKGEVLPVFPHKYIPGTKRRYDNIYASPFGSILTTDFALAALKGENLGKNKVTDFLAVSYSSTDYIGHGFGPNSIEVEDAYLRLDIEFEKLFNALDAQVGKGNYLVFLTADHGICDVPGHSEAHKLPGRILGSKILWDSLNEYLNKTFTPAKYLIKCSSYQYFIDYKQLKNKNISHKEFFDAVRTYLLKHEGIAEVIDLHNIGNTAYPELFINKIKNGINPKRSGDIFVMLEPGWLGSGKKGTTHGSLYEYDSHVPLIFYGWKLRPREVVTPVNITDIAPTLAAMLHILAPSGCIGTAIPEIAGSR
ncbi:MAG TPA: alkaline phosphatase family protein [Saprospiraceae bacterium]|nr:alkaline phosphatase family protein [Saprospiraceae bacterium]